MRRYRLHDLLRAAAVSWLAACSTGPTAPATSADASADSSLDASGTDAADTNAADLGDAAPDASGQDAATDAASDASAATDAGAVSDGSTATDVIDATAATDAGATDAGTTDATKLDGGVGPKLPYPCLDPQPIVVQGQDTGVDVCANGMIRRREAKACPAYQADQGFTCPAADSGWEGGCTTDADCPTGPCELGGFIPGCVCTAGCQVDADCGAGSICLCGPKVGTCVPSSCTSDVGCDTGSCGTYDSNPGCNFTAMACQTEGDECAVNSDCVGGGVCTWDSDKGRRWCAPYSCAIGRPFVVDGRWRTAESAARSDWTTAAATATDVALSGLSAAERNALGAWWQQTAAMEHASVASFARLTLELMAVGAPPELLARSQQAGLDEVRHAETCFALASHFLGRAVGPSTLPIAGALRQPGLADIAAAAAAEGCVWETAAALEARVAAASTHDPALRALLEQIADDEANHAELAWDLVRWALAAPMDAHEREAVRNAVAAALDEACAALAAAANDGDTPAAAQATERLPPCHGVLDAAAQRQLRAHALQQVIGPARAKLGV